MLALVEKTGFAAGQIDTVARHDNQKALYAGGCSIARNMRILNGGAMKRRPGTWLSVLAAANDFRGTEFIDKNGNSYKLLFSNGSLDIYDVNNSHVAFITGLPWTTAQLDALYLTRSIGTLVIANQAFWPQVVSLSDSGTWTCVAFVFDAAFSGGPAQPYYRYAAKLMTLEPSALTGSTTLTTSAAFFVSGHIGAYIRYLGNAILITGVTNGTTATGTVQGELPPTVSFSVSNASNFAVDEQVQGLTSGAQGVIVNISGTTISIVYVSNFGGIQNKETLVGDSSKAQATVTSGATTITPASVVDWDEQAFSAVRGYPGCAQTHRGRLYFLNMRDLPGGVAASADGLPNYFLIGANDGDSFFELMPDYKGQRALHLITADQGLILTDQAVYYLPEINSPVTPSTIDFKWVAPIGSSPIIPVPTEQGFAFVESGANRVIGILPTGSISAPWEVDDISEFWSELLTGPVTLGSNYQTAGFPERYGFVVNSDGSAACVKYQDAQAPVPLGWTQWTTANALYHQFFTANDKLFAVVEHTTPAAWTLEQFDDALLLDVSSSFTDPTVALPSTFYESTTVDIVTAPGWYRGSYAVNASDLLQGCALGSGTYYAGYDISTELKPTAPAPDHPAYRFGNRIKIPRAYLHVVDTVAYTINGQVFGGSVAQTSNPALVSGAKRWKLPGNAADLAPDITQQIPAPFEVAAITMEVSF